MHIIHLFFLGSVDLVGLEHPLGELRVVLPAWIGWGPLALFSFGEEVGYLFL